MQSLNGKWILAIDPQNIGKAEHWFEKVPIKAHVKIKCIS